MSTTYAGDNTNYPTAITIPSDGDNKPAASVNAALEGLADRTASLERRVVLSSFGTVVRTISEAYFISMDGSSPTWTSTGEGTKLVQASIDALGPNPNYFTQLLRLPHGCTLQSLSGFLRPHAGHAFLPSLPPGFTVYKRRVNTGAAPVLIGTGTATYADVAAYETLLEFDAAINEVIDNSLYIYWATFIGERDVDTSVLGAIFYGFTALLSVPTLDPGAA